MGAPFLSRKLSWDGAGDGVPFTFDEGTDRPTGAEESSDAATGLMGLKAYELCVGVLSSLAKLLKLMVGFVPNLKYL